ncbi:MAG: flagellar export protein FliJ [Desulfovibrio sp.]|jgi:flagellar FliJ protein|nr:flagellar export protein FliJ [Desulfovibrio sp.]
MATFHFKLEQVRIYRKRLEEEAMQKLALALAQRDALQKRLLDLENDLNAQMQRLSRSDLLSSAERWLLQSYVKALKQEKHFCAKALDEADNMVDIRRAELTQKARERDLLDTLKTKQAARHALLERQEERKNNDETATLRYRPAAV